MAPGNYVQQPNLGLSVNLENFRDTDQKFFQPDQMFQIKKKLFRLGCGFMVLVLL